MLRSAAVGGARAVRPHLPAQSPAAPCRKALAPPPAASTSQANCMGVKDSALSSVNDTKIISTIKLTKKKRQFYCADNFVVQFEANSKVLRMRE